MQKKEFFLSEIADLTGALLEGDPSKSISNVADLESAGPDDASFLANPLYLRAMEGSNAGVIFINKESFATIKLPQNKNFLLHDNPSFAFQQLIELFLENSDNSTDFGIHETAVIDPTVKIGKNVHIGPLSIIDKNVTIGDNTRISSGCIIGHGTTLGEDCYLYPRVTIRENCNVGNRVVIQPGAVIGSCGFGFITDKKGNHSKLKQLGTVIIEDDVEIGANSTIDRARFKSTIIGKGSKIDNLVQIAHGVIIGKHNIIVSQTGIAGSSETGNHVIIGGQVGVNGHIKICSGTMITAKSGVTKSIKQPGKYGGYVAQPLNEFNRNYVHSLKMDKYAQELKALTKRLDELLASENEY